VKIFLKSRVHQKTVAKSFEDRENRKREDEEREELSFYRPQWSRINNHKRRKPKVYNSTAEM